MPGSVQLPGATLGFNTDGSPGNLLELGPNSEATMGHIFSVGSAPTAGAGSNAGTTPPAPVVAATSKDNRGSVTGGTGTSPAAGNLIAVTFNQAFPAAPTVDLTSTTAAAALLAPYVASTSTTGFVIAVASAPAAGQANTVYGFNWSVLG
jgi:hypothetical protein